MLTSKGSVDGFNLQLDMNGAYVNAWRMGGAGFDLSRVIGVYGGRLYTAGMFEQTADFPTGGSLTSRGAWDVYLMGLDLPEQFVGMIVQKMDHPLIANGLLDGRANLLLDRAAIHAGHAGEALASFV